jgi:imidazolonepropionase-like amidohydrolase
MHKPTFNIFRNPVILVILFGILSACSSEEQAPESTAVAYEGARIITGDGSEPIDNGTLVVDNGLITMVGPTAAMQLPAGAQRVDLAGATIMPMMVDTHVHLSTTRDGLIQDLRNRVRFGINGAISMGMDGDDAILAMRDETIPGAARYFSAGRGITRPEPGRNETPHWVDTPGEAREAVLIEAARGVDIIKIWVDDRDGQYEKMTPEIYGAVIDEAHANDIRVTAHIFNQSDAKGLLEAGLDAFAHGVRDMDVDNDFVAMVQARPEVVLVPNMPYRGVPTDYGWVEGFVSAEQLQQLQAQAENAQAAEAWAIQARNLYKLNQAGMTIALGTDGNTPYAAHVEIEDMVIAGMTPMQVIVAATANSAAFLGMDDAGTLASGKSADFIVLDANPLEDITNTRRIREVIYRGESVER